MMKKDEKVETYFLHISLLLVISVFFGISCSTTKKEVVKDARLDRGIPYLKSKDGRLYQDLDTTHDGKIDVRRYYVEVAKPTTPMMRETRLVEKEMDLNGDGVFDVIRYYTNDASNHLQKELVDTDFDGTFEGLNFYEDGKIVRHQAVSQPSPKVTDEVTKPVASK